MNLRQIKVLFGGIAAFGSFMLMGGAETTPTDWFQIMLGSVLSGSGLLILIMADHREKKLFPQEAKSELNSIEMRWWGYRDFMFNLPWWLILGNQSKSVKLTLTTARK